MIVIRDPKVPPSTRIKVMLTKQKVGGKEVRPLDIIDLKKSKGT